MTDKTVAVSSNTINVVIEKWAQSAATLWKLSKEAPPYSREVHIREATLIEEILKDLRNANETPQPGAKNLPEEACKELMRRIYRAGACSDTYQHKIIRDWYVSQVTDHETPQPASNTEALLPCPHCGGPHVKVAGDEDHFCWVECESCEATGPCSTDAGLARKGWDTRDSATAMRSAYETCERRTVTEKDAARYEWLRENFTRLIVSTSPLRDGQRIVEGVRISETLADCDPQTVDQAIDAAIAREDARSSLKANGLREIARHLDKTKPSAEPKPGDPL